MRISGFFRSFLWKAAIPTIATVFSLAASGTQYRIKSFDFTTTGGTLPYGALVADAAGNLYGTTSSGGTSSHCLSGVGCGVVYELSPSGNGWTERILYNFCALANCADGAVPLGSLVFDSAGNLYGTTYGQVNLTGSVIFELSLTSSGWQETVLHTFCSAAGCSDGTSSRSSLILDSTGNLYGTTAYGGAHGKGVVFELAHLAAGWTETVLHAFSGGRDGANPIAGVTFDANGNLFGTAPNNGAKGSGVVFELSPGSGGWTENIIYAFTGKTDGAVPSGGLIIDTKGSVYGTANSGGNLSCKANGITGCGVVFELSLNSGTWSESVLYSFSGSDGAAPWAAPTFDSSGVLYGTTAQGGLNKCANESGCGTVWSLTPNSDGTWTEAVLHAFAGARDQREPLSPVILDAAGNIYGTSEGSFQYGNGSVFELVKF